MVETTSSSGARRARSASIQNMLDALRIASLQSGRDDENIDDDDEEDELDEIDEDRSSCSVESEEEFRKEMLRRAQDWQVPFVASTTFLQGLPTTTSSTTSNHVINDDNLSARATPNVLDSSTTTNMPTSFLATSKSILEAANKVKSLKML